MKKIIGGALAVIMGLPGFSLFFSDFSALLAGTVPVILILGGGLAFYLGYEDIKAENPKPLDGSDSQDKTIDTSEVSMVQPKPITSPEETVAEDVPPLDVQPLEDATETLPSAQTDDGIANGTAKFMGNTDTFVFHSIACNFSKGKKCTQGFTSRDDALEQGYKPCKVCSP